MPEQLAIADKVTFICLLRLERKTELNATSRSRLLERLPEEIRKNLPPRQGKLEEMFSSLGGASGVLLISSQSLENIAEIRETINEIVNTVVSQKSGVTESEIIAFPAVALKANYSSDLPIPTLTFMRTVVDTDMIHRLLGVKNVENCNQFIGYGSHSLVFYSRCANLSSIKNKVTNLARRFGRHSKTYTVIGVPSMNSRDREKELSGPPFLFHTALQTSSMTLGKRFKKEVRSITKNPRLACYFEGMKERDVIGYTPGRMDLLVNFKSTCVSDALDLACRFGDIEDVVDTVTWPDFCLF
jgi:hypothetical protein